MREPASEIAASEKTVLGVVDEERGKQILLGSWYDCPIFIIAPDNDKIFAHTTIV